MGHLGTEYATIGVRVSCVPGSFAPVRQAPADRATRNDCCGGRPAEGAESCQQDGRAANVPANNQTSEERGRQYGGSHGTDR